MPSIVLGFCYLGRSSNQSRNRGVTSHLWIRVSSGYSSLTKYIADCLIGDEFSGHAGRYFRSREGIRRLSNLNILLFSALLLFVLFCGPTLELLNRFVQNLGDYANGLILKTFDLYVYTDSASGNNAEWLGLWTLFYWGWWISWAPFVGMFIARISRGRTIRELVFGVLFIPLAFTLMWLSVFGNSAMDLVLNHNATALAQAAIEQPSMSIYLLLEFYPWAKIVIGMSVCQFVLS